MTEPNMHLFKILQELIRTKEEKIVNDQTDQTDIKENINLKLEFKAQFNPSTKLSDVRRILFDSIDSYLFQDYKKEMINKESEDQVTIRDLILKPSNQCLSNKFKLDLETSSKYFAANSFRFNIIEGKSIFEENKNPIGEGSSGIVIKGKYKAYNVESENN